MAKHYDEFGDEVVFYRMQPAVDNVELSSTMFVNTGVQLHNVWTFTDEDTAVEDVDAVRTFVARCATLLKLNDKVGRVLFCDATVYVDADGEVWGRGDMGFNMFNENGESVGVAVELLEP
jgi:hypothetical protein